MSTYNLEGVREMAGDDEEFVKVVVQTFLEEIPPDVAAMQQSIAQDNAQLAYQYAHKMKPNLQMFGLDLLQDVKNIESYSRGQKTRESIYPSVEKIVSTVRKATEELKRDFDL